MVKKSVKLKFNNILLDALFFEGGKYVFCANADGFKDARKQVKVIPFYLNESGTCAYDKLPHPFTNFLQNLDREDTIKNLNLKSTDTEFITLLKVASANINHTSFYITT